MSAKAKFLRLSISTILLATTVSVAFGDQSAYALGVSSRSMQLVAGVSDGGSKPSGVVNHRFTFTAANVGAVNIGSIKFEYCTVATGTGQSCAAAGGAVPTGLSTNGGGVTINASQTGNQGVPYTLDKTTQGAPFATRTATSVPINTTISLQLDGVTNPSATNTTFYVHISTYTGTDGATGLVDDGVVAASTATQIILSGIMPESITFCTAVTITPVGNVPDCSTAVSGTVTFPMLFSPSSTAYTTSQMAASTNATNGYSITVNGATLTSGGNTIPAMGSLAASAIGVGQFGMNLVVNTINSGSVGIAVFPSVGTNLKGQAFAPNYATADQYKFTSGDAVAKSDNAGAGPSDGQIFTVTYIVNVSGSQAAGTYASTLTYICTATF